MKEKDIESLLKEQKTAKPNIEDVVGDFLEGKTLKNAMEFIAFLRNNNMNPRWCSTNGWRVTGKKSKPICYIQLGGPKYPWMSYLKVGDWVIGELESLGRKYLDEFISSDEMKKFVWTSVKPCSRCSSCGPRSGTYMGKTYDECCALRIINPKAEGLELAKKLVEANKRFINAEIKS